MSLFTKVIGSRNQRVIKTLSRVVERINHLEEQFSKLDESEFTALTEKFRQRYTEGETLEELLPEAFAAVRETSKRTLGLRHFNVQLIGGMVLHQGKIAEMRTGEGKTLMATLAAYLNTLTGKAVHLVTVNDYLARRDAEWMSPIYRYLGLEVGINLPGLSADDKRSAYKADITYGTNNEFGFDYLRDNMAFSLEERVQRGLGFAIIDEVDSILIDEARTPLIISGPTENNAEIYKNIKKIAEVLEKRHDEEGPGDYYLDEKNRQAFLTESGQQHVESLLVDAGLLEEQDSLYNPSNIALNHFLNGALRARTLYQRDVDYIVKDGEVVIVDEHTGRTMPGRRWSEGLHQAVEAKEGVEIQRENQTLASITFQNYFRLYDKLSGMTGTADTEAYEFEEIYGLEVVVIPTNRPMVRQDYADKIYLTQQAKFTAVADEIKQCQERGQPVLVGTAAIETSEYLSKLLKKEKIRHQVLNAKFHDKEAKIIAEAGRPGAITIATNMAGRGTDIVLGGNLEAELAALGAKVSDEKRAKIKQTWAENHKKVIEAGGLAVIGSERHDSRRIDNQLRGRSGRQGDPGHSRFYLSLEDNLMRIFASPRVFSLMQKLGLKEDEAIEHSWVTKAIERAQRKVEGFYFDVRKQLLEYDNVANEQRQLVYEQRNELLQADDIADNVKPMRDEVVVNLIEQFIPAESLEEQWDIEGLEGQLASDFALPLELVDKIKNDSLLNHESISQWIIEQMDSDYAAIAERFGTETLRGIEKAIMLQTVDTLWREHLHTMDYLREGIHLRGYANKNPKQEYKQEAYNAFISMEHRIKYEATQSLLLLKLQNPNTGDTDMHVSSTEQVNAQTPIISFGNAETEGLLLPDGVPDDEPHTGHVGVGRNEPCPCGSGKKYKQCHGKLV
ncbi:MAG: preprotein translocase subunit SecA [Gammaproteobacteria bacterium]|nr:preprotein translocase subunit SecA [Gammaproteobacteria bacterium]